MKHLSILLRDRATAEAIQAALAAFNPALVEQAEREYLVEVALARGDELNALLAALHRYTAAHSLPPAKVDVDGSRYMLYAD